MQVSPLGGSRDETWLGQGLRKCSVSWNFHVCGKVNRYNVRIWGTESPHATVEHVHDSPKVSVFFAVFSCKVYSPFFFAESTVIDINYLDELQLWLIPQLQEDNEDFIFQQDASPLHFNSDVLAYLNANLPGRWIGRASDNASPLLPWPHGHLI
jgi:hypothetical protein